MKPLLLPPALLSCLSAQQCPCILLSPSRYSAHSCWNTPLLRITQSLFVALRIKFKIFTMAIKILHNLASILASSCANPHLTSYIQASSHCQNTHVLSDQRAFALPFCLECSLPYPHSYSRLITPHFLYLGNLLLIFYISA